MLRQTLFALALAGVAPAFAFSYGATACADPVTIVNGTLNNGQPQYAPVGNGASNSVPLPVQLSGGSPVGVSQQSYATTINNGTIASGGGFQQASPASARHALHFQNRSGNGDACYLYFGATGSATSAKSVAVQDGQSWDQTATPPSDALQVTCATTGDAYWESEQ